MDGGLDTVAPAQLTAYLIEAMNCVSSRSSRRATLEQG